MATIRDVAAQANVSPGTVSQLLNGRATLRPETRSRIERAVAQLGYEPGRVGRPRTRPQTLNIALVLGSLEPQQYPDHPLARRRTRYVREALVESGDHFSLFASGTHVDDNLTFQDAIEGGDLHGVILAGSLVDDGYLDWLQQRDIPLVLLQRLPDEAHSFSYVSLDDVGGGRAVAEHLIELGHERLAYVPPRRAFGWTHERRRGLIEAARRAGLPEPIVRPADPDIELDAGPAAVKPACAELIEAGVTGVFAANDGMAVRCVDALEQLGRRVPADVSVVGFDDVGYTSRSGLTPSSVGYDPRYMAQAAVSMIQRLIHEKGQVAELSARVKTHVSPHDTSGPASCPASRPAS